MHRFGLVGFGAIAENGHLPALQSLPGVAVAAVADISPERLDRARAVLPDAQLFDSPEELISRADVTAVDICTPPGTHADLMIAACRRGLATVVCEKPFVLTLDDFNRVAAARDSAGNRVVSVNNWMHSDLFRLVLAEIRSESIGRLERIVLRTGRPQAARGNAGWLPNWRTDLRHSGGGIILDHGWHQFYLLMGWARQPLQAVAATTRTIDPANVPVEDEAHIDLFFPQVHGRIELSWTSPERTNSGVIEGTSGVIAVHDDRIVVEADRGIREIGFAGRLTQSSYHPDWFGHMFQYNVLDENRAEADRNFAEAGMLVQAIGAAYRSAERGGELCTLSGDHHELPGDAPGEGTAALDVRSHHAGLPA